MCVCVACELPCSGAGSLGKRLWKSTPPVAHSFLPAPESPHKMLTALFQNPIHFVWRVSREPLAAQGIIDRIR